MTDSVGDVLVTVVLGMVLGGLLAYVWLAPLFHRLNGEPTIWQEQGARVVVTVAALIYMWVKIASPLLSL